MAPRWPLESVCFLLFSLFPHPRPWLMATVFILNLGEEENDWPWPILLVVRGDSEARFCPMIRRCRFRTCCINESQGPIYTHIVWEMEAALLNADDFEAQLLWLTFLSSISHPESSEESRSELWVIVFLLDYVGVKSNEILQPCMSLGFADATLRFLKCKWWIEQR